MSDLQAYTVGWICAIPTELAAARTFLDKQHPTPEAVARNDNNSYTLGTMGKHNVVIAILPKKEYGIAAAATVARDLVHTFPNIRIGLMVGVGGGAPSKQHDVRLGDVVIGSRDAGKGGIIQYDYGKIMQNQAFVETGSLNQPPPALLNAVAGLETEYMMQGPDLNSKVEKALAPWKRLQKTHSRPAANTDRLYKSDFSHPLNSSAACSQACDVNTANTVSRDERGEDEDSPAVHYGLIASANQVMKNAQIRDKLSAERGVLCFEMEAAGLMNHFPCLVIRGICDYSDSHKNKQWQGFAAMVAAAYAKDLLLQIAPTSVEAEKPICEVLGSIQRRLSDLKDRLKDLKHDKAGDLSVARNPHFVVPFPSDPDFVNRSDIWKWIQDQYTGPESRFALIGMGGFGKSQIAIHFAHQLRATSPKTSVLWVNATTKATFEESYRSIADVLALPRRHDPDVNVLALVRNWLQREDVSPWLMIIDNADDVKMLLSDNDDETYLSYLPKRTKSKILVTSRSRDAAERLTGNVKMVYTVPTMEETQGLQLFRNKIGRDVEEAASLRLVNTLDYVPLAISQAAAYIYRRSPRVTVESYLNEFRNSKNRKGTLLCLNTGDIQRYEGVSNSVVVTWQLTFDKIKRERPRAANLLSLMSYFHAQNIPDYMLHNYNTGNISATDGDDEIEETSNDEDFEDDLDVLQGFSLVSITATPGLLEMHSLVQFCTQVWISKFGSPDQWKTLFLQSASQHFPSGAFETWQQCQILMPHIQPLLNKQPSEERNQLEWSKLLTNVSSYLVMLGNYYRAQILVQDAVRVRIERLGEEHPWTLTSIGNLASTYRNQGRWKEAEELEVWVMETRKRVLGEDHPDTLTSMVNLALTYTNQGQWNEAEELQAKELGICSRLLGEEHPDTLTSIGNLASTYRNQGRWNEAEELEVRVMETSKRVLGEEHPETLTSMANLALTYMTQGRWNEAEELEVRVIETSKRVLGEEHPDTLTSMANLASTYMNQGRWKEAEKLGVRVMETRKRVLGEEHPDTLTSINNLALTYMNQGQWKEAEELQAKELGICSRVLGEEHPDTLKSMANLALTYRKQGRWKEAEELEVRVMETSKRVLGEEHPNTLTSMANLASTYRKQGRWKEAEKLEVRVIETSKRVLGEEHPNMLASMANLASTYRKQGRWNEAEKLEVRVIETSKRLLGTEHPNTLSSMANLALTYRNQGRWKEAEELGVRVMETRKRVLGEEHPDTLTSMHNLAFTWKDLKRWNDATQLLQDCIRLRENVLGVDHTDTISSTSALSDWRVQVSKNGQE